MCRVGCIKVLLFVKESTVDEHATNKRILGLHMQIYTMKFLAAHTSLQNPSFHFMFHSSFNLVI